MPYVQEPNGSFAKAQSEKTQAGTNRPIQSNKIRQRRTPSPAVVSDSGRVSKRVPQVGLHQVSTEIEICHAFFLCYSAVIS